ncbi:MAG TPA: hypothetical protein VMF66_08275 [Candidatus Acidoferrum sp.]|nr:hypothetical protein [Candidatus Acidoferrum sp.]
MAPVLLQVAQVSSGGKELTAAGIKNAIWITILITIATTGFIVLLYLAGRGPATPEFERMAQRGSGCCAGASAWRGAKIREAVKLSARFGRSIFETPNSALRKPAKNGRDSKEITMGARATDRNRPHTNNHSGNRSIEKSSRKTSRLKT